MQIRFTKMHGAGNDFVIIDTTSQPFVAEPWRVRQIADRRTGVGCDQLLVLAAPKDPRNAVAYRVYNASGEEAEQCGNGARCVAALVAGGNARKSASGGVLRMESVAGVLEAQVLSDGMVSVNMGEPDFAPSSAGFAATAQADAYPLELAGGACEIGVVSMGNPHAVVEVPDIDTADVAFFGPAIGSHARFAQGANVGFVQRMAPERLRLRVFERGAGETPACGTGACAAAAVLRARGLTGEQVSIDLPGGRLMVKWMGLGAALWLTGPAIKVFTGTIDP